MLTASEKAALKVFREYMVRPGEMLCICGPVLDKHRVSLRRLTEREYLTKEQFKGGYSLTSAGFAAMRDCQEKV